MTCGLLFNGLGESTVDVHLSVRVRRLVGSHVWQASFFGFLMFQFTGVSQRGRIRLNCVSCWTGLMHTCHDAPVGGRVRLGRDGRISIARRVFILVFVFEDHLVIVDNCCGVAFAPLFVVGCVKCHLLCLFRCLGSSHLVFATKRIPLGPGDHSALFGQRSRLLAEPIVLLPCLSVTFSNSGESASYSFFYTTF